MWLGNAGTLSPVGYRRKRAPALHNFLVLSDDIDIGPLHSNGTYMRKPSECHKDSSVKTTRTPIVSRKLLRALSSALSWSVCNGCFAIRLKLGSSFNAASLCLILPSQVLKTDMVGHCVSKVLVQVT